MTVNFSGAVFYLISTLLTLYCFCILARILLQAIRADFYNPICQFVVKATDPFLRPLHRIIPTRPVDFAAILLLVLVQAIILILKSILTTTPFSLSLILILSVISCVRLLLDFFFYAIIIQVVLSWIQPGGYNPMTQILYQLTEPLLAPIRKILPDMGGLDLSPMVALLLLYTLQILFPFLR